MAELGLFSAANPVTYSNPAAAVAAGLQSDPQAADPCVGIVPVEDLPPELADQGYVDSFACYESKGKPAYANRFQAQICSLVVFEKKRWVKCDLGAILARNAAGTLVLVESPCLIGYGRPSYRTLDLQGNELCTTVPADNNPRDPIPQNLAPGGGLGQGLVTGIPSLRGFAGGGGRLPITVSGVNLSDLANLLAGTQGTPDLSGVLNILAALVVQGGNIRQSLDALGPGVGDAVVASVGNLADVLDNAVPGIGARLAQALDRQGDKSAAGAERAAASTWGAAPGATEPIFQSLVHAAATVLAPLADTYKSAVDTLVVKILDLFRDDIEAHAPVTPANVDKVAAAALRSALTAGSVAQLAGMGLELLHPLKNLGVQQAIGVLATFAGFEEIAKPFFGATLRYGIGLPAEHRAAAHFRTVLPPLETVRELAAMGLVPPPKYHQRLELAGYPDPYPAALVDVLYTPPNARFLGQLMDGSEADRPWLARQFRRLGFSPENTDRAVRALELKTTAPGRGRLVSTLLAEYKAGHLGDHELDQGLVGAGLSVTHRAYYRRVAELERRGTRMDAVATAVLLQYRNNVVGEALVTQALGALGFTPDEVTVRVTAEDLRRGLKAVQDEDKDIEAEIRALKAKGLALATRQLRAGFLDLGTFVTVGQGMGYSRAFLQTAAGIALLEGAPKTSPDGPAIGRGALEETRARIADLLALQVRDRQLDRVAAFAAIIGLGIPQDLASVLVDLADAIAGPAPFAGDFGVPGTGRLGGVFGELANTVLGGLRSIGTPRDLVATVLQALGLPGRDRATLVRLIRDLQDLFRG